jgi:ATP-binding cassette subfamily F protein 3
MASFSSLMEKRQQMRALEAEMGKTEADLEKLMDQYAQLTSQYEMANGYACENIARRILIGLGFTLVEFNQPLSSFSGGQKTRLNLGRLLALNPDILLLDEPTNHLDLKSVEWLESFLQSYRGTVIVVSHDRRFLDQTTNRIAELKGGELKTYQGNYSEFILKKTVEDMAAEKAYQKQQEYIRKTEDYIRRFKAGIKSKQARGRQSQLERLERVQSASHERHLGKQRIKISQTSGNKVITLQNIRKLYGGNVILDDVNLEIERGDKVALIGPNGCGKTTLLKIITGQVQPEQGKLEIGHQGGNRLLFSGT